MEKDGEEEEAFEETGDSNGGYTPCSPLQLVSHVDECQTVSSSFVVLLTKLNNWVGEGFPNSRLSDVRFSTSEAS